MSCTAFKSKFSYFPKKNQKPLLQSWKRDSDGAKNIKKNKRTEVLFLICQLYWSLKNSMNAFQWLCRGTQKLTFWTTVGLHNCTGKAIHHHIRTKECTVNLWLLWAWGRTSEIQEFKSCFFLFAYFKLKSKFPVFQILHRAGSSCG